MQPISLKRYRDFEEDEEGPIHKWRRLDMGEPILYHRLFELKRKRDFSTEDTNEEHESKRIRLEEKILSISVETLTIEEDKNLFQTLPDHLISRILVNSDFPVTDDQYHYYPTISMVCRKWFSCAQKAKSGRYNEIESRTFDLLEWQHLENALEYAKKIGNNLSTANLSRYKYINNDQLYELAVWCPNISTLILKDALITDVAFTIMAGLPKLEILEIRWCDDIYKPEPLAKLSKLKKLIFSHCRNLKSFPDLAHFNNLQIFEIHWCNQLTLMPQLPLHILPKPKSPLDLEKKIMGLI